MIRRVARTLVPVAIIVGWVMALIWLTLSVAQITVGRAVFPECAAGHPTGSVTETQLHRVLSQEMTRC